MFWVVFEVTVGSSNFPRRFHPKVSKGLSGFNVQNLEINTQAFNLHIHTCINSIPYTIGSCYILAMVLIFILILLLATIHIFATI